MGSKYAKFILFLRSWHCGRWRLDPVADSGRVGRVTVKRRVVVIGGGIAGLSAAWNLARERLASVTMLEREQLLCTHASGHNAAIFRPLEADAELAALALESRSLFELVARARLVDARGLLLLHPAADELGSTLESASRLGVDCELLAPEQVAQLLEGLTLNQPYYGLYSRTGGVIDIHELAKGLRAASRSVGVEVRTGATVERILASSGRVVAVQTTRETIAADDVVIAGGAWSKELGASIDCPLPLSPMRRHLALLKLAEPLAPNLPVVWRLQDEVYFRREGERVLASPCDETPWPPGAPQATLEALAPLAPKLTSVGRELAEASVVRYWACLRTFSPDRRPVIGADPRVLGLHWLAALGGFGMSTAVAAGQVLARTLGRAELAPAFSPARLCNAPGDAT